MRLHPSHLAGIAGLLACALLFAACENPKVAKAQGGQGRARGQTAPAFGAHARVGQRRDRGHVRPGRRNGEPETSACARSRRHRGVPRRLRGFPRYLQSGRAGGHCDRGRLGRAGGDVPPRASGRRTARCSRPREGSRSRGCGALGRVAYFPAATFPSIDRPPAAMECLTQRKRRKSPSVTVIRCLRLVAPVAMLLPVFQTPLPPSICS